MELTAIFQSLGIALGLGLLVGLQRERAASRLAGLRTFPLVTILGAISGLLAQSFGAWTIGSAWVALAAVIVIGNIAKLRAGEIDPGVTTEVAILLMFGVGAYLVVGYREAAIAVGGVIAVLLQFKGQLHGIAKKLSDDDLKAVMQFALISLVILPVLPNRTYGPYAVLNPRQVWWMVVLIVGISLGGYIVYKFFGETAGAALGGVLGGSISSTATSVSYARRTTTAPESSKLAATVIMIAAAVVVIRVLIEIAVVAPGFLSRAAPPLLALLLVMAALSVFLWLRVSTQQVEMPALENPSELKSAVVFGILYAVVLVAVAAAESHFGNRGLYVVAALSGLTDVDATTLSASQLVNSGRLDSDDGWKLIMIAITSNLLFKCIAIAAIGHRRLLVQMAPLFGAGIAVGLLILVFWPRIG